jgi:hypothetical protein
VGYRKIVEDLQSRGDDVAGTILGSLVDDWLDRSRADELAYGIGFR